MITDSTNTMGKSMRAGRCMGLDGYAELLVRFTRGISSRTNFISMGGRQNTIQIILAHGRWAINQMTLVSNGALAKKMPVFQQSLTRVYQQLKRKCLRILKPASLGKQQRLNQGKEPGKIKLLNRNNQSLLSLSLLQKINLMIIKTKTCQGKVMVKIKIMKRVNKSNKRKVIKSIIMTILTIMLLMMIERQKPL